MPNLATTRDANAIYVGPGYDRSVALDMLGSVNNLTALQARALANALIAEANKADPPAGLGVPTPGPSVSYKDQVVGSFPFSVKSPGITGQPFSVTVPGIIEQPFSVTSPGIAKRIAKEEEPVCGTPEQIAEEEVPGCNTPDCSWCYPKPLPKLKQMSAFFQDVVGRVLSVSTPSFLAGSVYISVTGSEGGDGQGFYATKAQVEGIVKALGGALQSEAEREAIVKGAESLSDALLDFADGMRG